MMRTQLARMLQPGGRDHLGQRQQRVAVIVKDPLGLVGNDQSALPDGVLRSDAGGPAVGVARQRLDAANREPEAAPGKIGSASCRERVCQSVKDSWGSGELKTKK